MVERFVQSLGQLNDSGSCFDSSFEIKNILHSPGLMAAGVAAGQPLVGRQRHRCLTELDREQITSFVREFEARQAAASTPKAGAKCRSPYICRKAKEIYLSASGRRSASPQIQIETVQEVDEQQQEEQQQELDYQVPRKAAEAEDLMPPPQAMARAETERRSCRRAARVLHFFSSATKLRCGSRKLSTEMDPVETNRDSLLLLHQKRESETDEQLAYRLGSGSDNDDDEKELEEEEHDDGISSASSNLTSQSGSCDTNSRNISPDSSFEMHAPILPSFKVTPPRAGGGVCKAGKSAASEFARFLRSSFHAKRASITTLRRSLSDPDAMQQLDFTKPPPLTDVSNVMRVSHF